MDYYINDFIKKDRKVRKEHFKEFVSKQKYDFIASYIFIILSSCKPILSLQNGAIWVGMWYTASILLSWYMHINQWEYNIGVKKSVKFARRHVNCTVQKGYKFTAEIGGWNLVAAQYLSAIVLTIPLMFFAFGCQMNNYDIYMNNYRDFCTSLFFDTYVLVFFTIYYRGCWYDIIESSDWKKSMNNLLSLFGVSKIKNAVVHILSIVMVIVAFTHYFTNEFAGLFGINARRVIGVIYIFIMLDGVGIIKCLLDRRSEKREKVN